MGDSLGLSSPNQRAEGRGQRAETKNSLLLTLYSLFVSTAYADKPTPADLAETVEVQFTQEIKDLAKSLGNNPVAIYEYVRNNFEYEPYYGSLKGAQQTLWERAGNDFDLASLLIALYRVSGIPARYVYGTIEIPIEKVKSWVGVEDPKTCGDIFASAGIPAAFGTKGGKITKIKIEHTWVKAWIDYVPSRGAIHKKGDTWIPLDPSFKQYYTKEEIDIFTRLPFDTNAYLSKIKSLPPILEYFDQINDYLEKNMPDKSLSDVLRLRGVTIEEFDILLASLPYKNLTTPNKYREIPDKLRYKIGFRIGELNYILNMPELRGKKVTLSYLPITVDDEQVIQAYGGLYNTPAYLVNLKPALKIEGETKATGNEIGMGSNQDFTLEFISPTGTIDRINNDIIAGGYYGIGIATTKADPNIIADRFDMIEIADDILTANDDTKIGELLNTMAVSHLAQITISETILESLMHVVALRSPSEAIASLKLSIDYLYGIPYSVEISGFNLDVDRYISTPFSITGDHNKEREYMKLAGLNMSYYEHAALEQITGIDSISAVKAIQIANENGVPIYRIDNTNIDTILPLLQVSKAVKNDIQNAINAGKVVTIPEKNIQRNEWKGVGYIILDPDTGEGTYMISGGLAGTDTTLSVKRASWLKWIGSLLKNKASIVKGYFRDIDWYYEAVEYNCWYGRLLWIRLLRMGYLPKADKVESKDKFFKHLLKPLNKIFYFIGHGALSDGSPRLVLKAPHIYISPSEVAEKIATAKEKPDYIIVFLSACFSAENKGEFFKAFNTEVGIGWKIDVDYTRLGGAEPISNIIYFSDEFWRGAHAGKTIKKAFDDAKASSPYYSNAYLYPPEE